MDGTTKTTVIFLTFMVDCIQKPAYTISTHESTLKGDFL